MAIEHNLIARNAAARTAVIIADENTHENAVDMLRGCLAGFLTACAEVDGWDRTLAMVNEFARASRVPAEVEKPKLELVRTGSAA